MHPIQDLAGEMWDNPDIRAAHTNGHRSVLVTGPQPRKWQMRSLNGEDSRVKGKPGSRMIGAGTVLLGFLAAGLLGVSVNAQYVWVFHARHQSAVSWTEAVALDIAMMIFSLMALGLARNGLPSRVERTLIIVCALGSAVMNWAAADVTSPRSVLAYVMPPLLLALVIDRVVASVRRHVLGMTDTSAWQMAGTVCLYALRTVLDPWPTAKGVRRMVLNATPLPEPGKRAITEGGHETTRGAGPRPGSKTSQFLDLVTTKYGPFAHIDPGQVSPISTELAPMVSLDVGAARTALGRAVRAARDGDPA